MGSGADWVGLRATEPGAGQVGFIGSRARQSHWMNSRLDQAAYCRTRHYGNSSVQPSRKLPILLFPRSLIRSRIFFFAYVLAMIRETVGDTWRRFCCLVHRHRHRRRRRPYSRANEGPHAFLINIFLLLVSFHLSTRTRRYTFLKCTWRWPLKIPMDPPMLLGVWLVYIATATRNCFRRGEKELQIVIANISYIVPITSLCDVV